METALPFDRKDLNRINTHLLIAIHAFQHAEMDVFKDHLNTSETEKVEIFKEINALLPKKMEAVLSMLYTSFGMTPDILLKSDDE